MRTLDFRLDIATKDAQKNVEKFNNELEETQQLTELELTLKNADAVKSVKELNEAMEKLQDQALKFDKGSDEFIKAATKAGELKKRMDDVNKSIDTVASGGQLGQITTSFEGLKQSALTFDIEGLTRNFALMKTQITGAAASALGLGQGLNVATIAARGLAVALAATGITIIIAAIAILVSEFENLADAGGLIGTIFTAIGDAVQFAREKILELLDALGLIDLQAQKSKQEQADKLKELEDDFKANADAYDELTKSKKQADLDYLKIVEETNKRQDISEKRKNDLIELYNAKRIRAIRKAELEDAKRREAAEKEEKARQKQLAAEKEARELGFIKEAAEKRLDVIKNASLEEIIATYEAYNQGRILEQQIIDKNIEIRLEATKNYIEEETKTILEYKAKGFTEEQDEVKEAQDRLLQLRLDLVGQQATIIQKKEAEVLQKRLNDLQNQIIENEGRVQSDLLTQTEIRLENEQFLFQQFNEQVALLYQQRSEGIIINDAQFNELLLAEHERYQQALSIQNERYAYDDAIFEEKLALKKVENIEAEMNELKIASDEKLAIATAQYDAESKAAQQVFDAKMLVIDYLGQQERISDEEYIARKLAIQKEYNAAVAGSVAKIIEIEEERYSKGITLGRDYISANLELLEAERVTITEQTNFEIAEAQRLADERQRIFQETAGQIQNIGGFINDSVNSISDIMSSVHDKRLFEIEEEYTAEYNSLQAQKQAGLISEQQLSAGLAQIEEKRRKAKYKADKKAFEQEKAIRITQAVMSTIQASLAAYSSGAAIPVIGTVMGPIFAAIAAAFGAAQIGMIASEKFPSYQSAAAPPTPSVGGGGGGASGAGAAAAIPPSFYTNSGAVQGSNVMLNPGGIYQAPGSGNQQVWVLESDITGSQNQVQVTEDRSYFDAGAYGG